VAWSGPRTPPPEFDFKVEKRNPVSHLRFNNARTDFQFAIVSDRTGGHRARVFSRAVEQLNLLQPEFVVSVGDLIEGYTDNRAVLAQEWREFQSYVARLQMPFFFVPGNHDLANKLQDRLWQEKFGRRYYEFVYRNVLFLMLNSEDPPGTGEGKVSADQIAWLKKTLEANAGVRWTLVFLHRPLWVMTNTEKTGWLEAEKLLKGRPYTVFAGHVHRYQKFVRQGQNYYMLATTGGASKMRGPEQGEFDHIVWVTMKKDGPVLANILLDGILPENLQAIETAETGVLDYYRRPTHPVRGRILFESTPLANAYVVLNSTSKETRPPRADAFTAADGTFSLSTYTANDGAPAGDYKVTVVWRKPFFTAEGKLGPNLLPARYASAETSGLTFTVKRGENRLDIELKK
jgi:hypothetical protein